MELSLPAGNLQAALTAFKGGADSVYLGLKNFSARQGAQNFSLDELSKLMAFAKDNDKKVFITLNTIVRDGEFPKLQERLNYLAFFEVDGLIVQDLGLAKYIKENYPTLALHASTQTACHTVEGVKFLRDFGFERIVLARELSFEEIKKIRIAVPDVELKVFIHGAMCYSFSGLCQASRQITGRSSNRGQCAQICRTWFTQQGKPGFYFSMKDLCLGNDVLKLQEIGIDAVKIEGRMKSSLYTYTTAKYYKAVLAGEKITDPFKENMLLAFARDRESGYFNFEENQQLINQNYTENLGLKIGEVVKKETSYILVKLSSPISIHDGLVIINNDITSPSAKFGVQEIIDKHGYQKSFANIGEIVALPINHMEDFSFHEGATVYRISRHDSTMSLISENIKHFKKLIPITYSLNKDCLSLSCTLLTKDYPLEMQKARKPSDFEANLKKVLSESDDSYFGLSLIQLKNSLYKNDELFVPISALKEIRRDFYKELDVIQTENFKANLEVSPVLEAEGNLPDRALLGQWDEVETVEGKKYLPLRPVMFDEKEYLNKITELVANSDIIVGLNNIGQLNWAKSHPEIKVFIDVFLYIANTYTAHFYFDFLPNLIGGYSWLEEKIFNREDWPFVASDTQNYRAPIFISRMPFNGYPILEQNGRKYKVTSKDGLTVVNLDE